MLDPSSLPNIITVQPFNNVRTENILEQSMQNTGLLNTITVHPLNNVSSEAAAIPPVQ